MSEQFLTPNELVKRLKDTITEKTLANWRSKGIGPKFTKIGPQKILYPISEVISWEQAQTKSSTEKEIKP